LPPHPDYAVIERMFGTASADSCDVTFQFGHDGKPHYIPGPGDSPTVIRRRLERLRNKLGDEGFDVRMPT
jgi:hypothetical protein